MKVMLVILEDGFCVVQDGFKGVLFGELIAEREVAETEISKLGNQLLRCADLKRPQMSYGFYVKAAKQMGTGVDIVAKEPVVLGGSDD